MKKLWSWIQDMYRQHEEGINYLIFGFLAFVLNYILFILFNKLPGVDYLIATALSWVVTVIFAYWTNRTFVFKSRNTGAAGLFREFVSFIGARVATELLELLLMFLMVDAAGMGNWGMQLPFGYVLAGENIAKLIGQAVVILTNYFLSKLWIFKEKK